MYDHAIVQRTEKKASSPHSRRHTALFLNEAPVQTLGFFIAMRLVASTCDLSGDVCTVLYCARGTFVALNDPTWVEPRQNLHSMRHQERVHGVPSDTRRIHLTQHR